jgi:hypothetical protein
MSYSREHLKGMSLELLEFKRQGDFRYQYFLMECAMRSRTTTQYVEQQIRVFSEY